LNLSFEDIYKQNPRSVGVSGNVVGRDGGGEPQSSSPNKEGGGSRVTFKTLFAKKKTKKMKKKELQSSMMGDNSVLSPPTIAFKGHVDGSANASKKRGSVGERGYIPGLGY
jgi:hypothetical protein